MKPVGFRSMGSNKDITHFVYKEDKLKEWHERGEEHGDCGFRLLYINYATGFYHYEGYGTIESPCTELRTISIQHSPAMDGEIPTPEQILAPISKKEAACKSHRMVILDLRHGKTKQ